MSQPNNFTLFFSKRERFGGRPDFIGMKICIVLLFVRVKIGMGFPEAEK